MKRWENLAFKVVFFSCQLNSFPFLGISESSELLELDIETAVENFSDRFFKLGGLAVVLELGLGLCGLSRIGFDITITGLTISHKNDNLNTVFSSRIIK